MTNNICKDKLKYIEVRNNLYINKNEFKLNNFLNELEHVTKAYYRVKILSLIIDKYGKEEVEQEIINNFSGLGKLFKNVLKINELFKNNNDIYVEDVQKKLNKISSKVTFYKLLENKNIKITFKNNILDNLVNKFNEIDKSVFFEEDLSMEENYYKIYNSYPSLTTEEEYCLFKNYKNNNCIISKDIIVKSNLKRLTKMVKKYIEIYDNYEINQSYFDLFHIGMISLLESIEKYDYKNEMFFSTFAINNIYLKLRDNYEEVTKLVLTTTNLINCQRKIYKVYKENLLSELDDIELIKNSIGHLRYNLLSDYYNTYQFEYNVDIIDNQNRSILENLIIKENEKEILLEMFKSLEENIHQHKNYEDIFERFGVYDGVFKQQKYIANKNGCTKADVSEKETKTFLKVRKQIENRTKNNLLF